MLASEVDELLGSGDDSPALGAAGDRDPASATELQQPFIAQRPKRTQDGVGVDADDRGEIAGGRQPLARRGFSIGDCASDLSGDLLV